MEFLFVGNGSRIDANSVHNAVAFPRGCNEKFSGTVRKTVDGIFLTGQVFYQNAAGVLCQVGLHFHQGVELLCTAAAVTDIGFREYGERVCLTKFVCGKEPRRLDVALQDLVGLGL